MAPYPETALLLQLKDIIPNMLNAVYILHLHIITFYLEETLLVLQILHIMHLILTHIIPALQF